jgi:hypothetical protein
VILASNGMLLIVGPLTAYRSRFSGNR